MRFTNSLGIFHHYHCVSSIGHWCTRHNANCFASIHCNFWFCTCCQRVDNAKLDRNLFSVCGTNGITVDCSVAKWRNVLNCNNVLIQDPASHFRVGNLHGGQR